MQRKSILSALGLALVVTVLASRPAVGVPVTLVSQERYVHAYYSGNSYDISAADFGPFSAVLSPLPEYNHATQESVLGSTVTASLSALGRSGITDSWLQFQFTIAESVEYVLEATLMGDLVYDGSGESWIALTQPAGGGNQIFWEPDRGPSPYSLTRAGTLDPGTYTLYSRAQASRGSQGGWGSGEVSFTFSLTPEPSSLILSLFALAVVNRRCKPR